MSIETWKEEFYPIPAREATDPLDHSMLKWSGLTPENLAKHGVHVSGSFVIDDETHMRFGINSDTCALCVVHMRINYVVGKCCGDCPLTKVRGVHCDRRLTPHQIAPSPYQAFTDGGDPTRMIELLKKAKEKKEADERIH